MPVKIEIVELRDLKHGDQIAVMGDIDEIHTALRPFMTHAKGKYFHHGIYDKETLEVIEFHGDNKASARPKRRPLLQFTCARYPLYRVVHEKCLPVETTMKMANEEVDNKNSWPDYDLIENNCETFATYLKTGHKYSEQAVSACLNFLQTYNAELALAACLTGGASVVAASAGVAFVGAASFGGVPVSVGSVGAVKIGVGSIGATVAATGCFAAARRRDAQTKSE